MKIVVTDARTLNPGDLDWSPITSLGDTKIYDYTAKEEIVSRCKDANILLVNKTPIDSEIIGQLPELKFIGVMATGYNNIDITACRDHNIVVSNVRDYGSHSVAQHTFALLLELTNHVGLHDQAVKKGEWCKKVDFCFWEKPIIDLHDKTIGIIGLGQIGSQVARIASGFGMHVISYHKHPERDYFEDIHFVTLEKLFEDSDFVTLHCSLNEGNIELINKNSLAQMKPTAYLVNTSRGGLINETDLADALKNNRIAGAALDVLCQEPPANDHPLIGLQNCIITPHNAWASKEARTRLLKILTENVISFINGRPINVVHL